MALSRLTMLISISTTPITMLFDVEIGSATGRPVISVMPALHFIHLGLCARAHRLLWRLRNRKLLAIMFRHDDDERIAIFKIFDIYRRDARAALRRRDNQE